MKHVRLEAKTSSFRPPKSLGKYDAAVTVGHLKAHLTGNVYQYVNNACHRIVNKDRKALAEDPAAVAGNLSKLEEAKQALEDAEAAVASAIEEREKKLARVFIEMEAAGDEGHFAERKRRQTEIAVLRDDQLDVLVPLREDVNMQDALVLMAKEADEAFAL